MIVRRYHRAMKLRRVPADVLLHKPVPKALSPRARKRAELEATLAPVIRDAAADPGVAFRVTLDEDERIAAVRAAVKRVRQRVGALDVNVVTIDGQPYIAARPSR